MSEGTIATWGDEGVEEFGTGLPIADKKQLVGIPFLIGKVSFRKGDFGPFVSVTAVNQANEEFVFNDGSSGVYAQIVNKLHESGKLDESVTKPDMQDFDVRWACRRGLRVSEYEGPGGKPARTYYVS